MTNTTELIEALERIKAFLAASKTMRGSAENILTRNDAPLYEADLEALVAALASTQPSGDVRERVAETIRDHLSRVAIVKKEIGDGWDVSITPDDLADAILAALSATPVERCFQNRVGDWMEVCFTPEITADKLERNDRFIEEALELAQSTGYSADRAHSLVDYVFSRDKGEPSQEVGGVMVTLAALCNPHGLNMAEAAETELARIMQPEIVEKIRAKQKTKPTGSALPVPTPVERWRNGTPPQEPANKAWLVHQDGWKNGKVAKFSAGAWWIDGNRYGAQLLPFDRHAEVLAPPAPDEGE